MRVWSILTSLMFVTMILAGCADEPVDAEEATGEEVVDKEGFQFSSGKGAIAGLLVDDRFRPIDLEADGASGEFQAAGFILVQETGQQLRTNENGEFNVLDLDPGTYTLRVSAEGHEAIPQKVQVSAGEFAEINLVARRKASDTNTILTEEYSGFIPCATGGAVAVTANCLLDLSGDSYRPGPIIDFTKYNPDLHYLVFEAETNQAGGYDLVVRRDNAETYARTSNDDFEKPYFKTILAHEGNTGVESGWNNDIENMEALVFYFEEQVAGQELLGGFRVAISVSYLISIFLYDAADVDLESYCIKCENTMAG